MSAQSIQKAPITGIDVDAYVVPTDAPESDGTLAWDSTTMVVVRAHAANVTGIGYTYAGLATATVIRQKLSSLVIDDNALTPAYSWQKMQNGVRNLGKPGIAAEAISAVDIALWDLYARLLELPLSTAIGAIHESTPIYGSGGFTSYDTGTLTTQLCDWVNAGIPRVKMKVGRQPAADEERVHAVRETIGYTPELYVDANGAYSRKQALLWAQIFAQYDVRWLEEPVSSDDLEGLHQLRDTGPAGMDITAGEYGYHLPYFHHMLAAGAVDCLQADVTRCLGISGIQRVAALCDARSMDLSLHCAPQISAHAGTSIWHLRHLEYFHDHVRIERLAFDGILEPESPGVLRPDRTRPGHGLSIKDADMEQYKIRGTT